MRDLLRSTVLVLVSAVGCGGNLSPTSGDAGDASSSVDGCGKCVDGAPGFPDAGADGMPSGDCPPQAPATWTVTCGGGTQVCNYPGTTDAGADADIACVCQPHGEDILEYDCATY